MKRAIFTLLLFSIIGWISCKKNTVQLNIEQQDNQNILSYISANGITGMQRDTVGGDTSGIYYKVILNGVPGTSYKYTDSISFVYTILSFDGLYSSPDTTVNHYSDFAGHLANKALPYGLQLVIHDVLKKGGSMRILIPSHLAYGVAGYGVGSKLNVNSRIGGNQCLDYYVHSINNQAAYDDQVIRSYFAQNTDLVGYQRTPDGLWYLVHTPGTGTDVITSNTSVTSTYTGYELNATIFDQYNTTDGSGITQDIPDLSPGLIEGLEKFATTGAYVSFFIPSTLAYGHTTFGGALPPNSVVHYEIRIIGVSP